MIQPKSNIKGYALVIDKATGMPYIDSPLSVPDKVWNALSEEQQQFANANVENHLRRNTNANASNVRS